MNDHDVIEQHDCTVTCRCGRAFTGSSLEDARRRHEGHFGVEMARAQIGGKD